MVFPFFPVGRAKLLGKNNLDAAHISPGEICGLTLPNNLLLSVPSVASVVKLFGIVPAKTAQSAEAAGKIALRMDSGSEGSRQTSTIPIGP